MSTSAPRLMEGRTLDMADMICDPRTAGLLPGSWFTYTAAQCNE